MPIDTNLLWVLIHHFGNAHIDHAELKKASITHYAILPLICLVSNTGHIFLLVPARDDTTQEYSMKTLISITSGFGLV